VQSFFGDGGVALHTRSAKYGRLRRGQLVQVPPLLVRRLKQHFCRLPRHGVEAVLGCNGWLWLQPLSPAEAARDHADAEADAVRDAAAAARPEEAPDEWERHAASAGAVGARPGPLTAFVRL
jgi:exosome complex component RRP4